MRRPDFQIVAETCEGTKPGRNEKLIAESEFLFHFQHCKCPTV